MTSHAAMTPEQYVQDKAAASGSSFYYAFLFLPPPRPDLKPDLKAESRHLYT